MPADTYRTISSTSVTVVTLPPADQRGARRGRGWTDGRTGGPRWRRRPDPEEGFPVSLDDLLRAGLLLLAGLGAGVVGYTAGLASLVSFPVLLALGVPP